MDVRIYNGDRIRNAAILNVYLVRLIRRIFMYTQIFYGRVHALVAMDKFTGTC